jgi:hypothetical protein
MYFLSGFNRFEPAWVINVHNDESGGCLPALRKSPGQETTV